MLREKLVPGRNRAGRDACASGQFSRMSRHTVSACCRPAVWRLLVLLLPAIPAVANADYFGLYLQCEGKVSSAKGKKDARIDLALRDNNQTALIQQSNVLPVGEKMNYEVSPATYSMTYRAPGVRTRVYYDWLRGQLFVWDPSLQRLAAVRLSIDRQTGKLDGQLLNSDERRLASISMDCQPISPEDLPKPKF